MRNPRRTAGTASALMVGVAVVTLFTVFAASLKASIDDTIDRSLRRRPGGDDRRVRRRRHQPRSWPPTSPTCPRSAPPSGSARASPDVDGEHQAAVDRRSRRRWPRCSTSTSPTARWPTSATGAVAVSDADRRVPRLGGRRRGAVHLRRRADRGPDHRRHLRRPTTWPAATCCPARCGRRTRCRTSTRMVFVDGGRRHVGGRRQGGGRPRWPTASAAPTSRTATSSRPR